METVPWHQDNTYWPSVRGTDVVSVWLAIDDADAENSAMMVIPGSHAGYREQVTVSSEAHEMLDKKIVVTAEMEAKAVTLEMAAGSVSIHDSFLLHASASNRSGRRRAGYTIRYCSSDTVRVDLNQHPIPVYLMRGEADDDHPRDALCLHGENTVPAQARRVGPERIRGARPCPLHLG